MSIFPYFIGGVVELPVTMPMDHTLFDILAREDVSEWTRKADWIRQKNGMALVIVHPDYMTSAARFRLYDELLASARSRLDCWFARAGEISSWWRARDASALRRDGAGGFVITGPAADRASIEWLCRKESRTA
jgi:hypothetical protein